MNYINKLASFAVLVIALSGCDFNEDFCIRNGELVAWCDFSGIKEPLPIPAQRHMIAFPLGHTDIPSGTETAFTQDTLRWSIPQGEYRFLFYKSTIIFITKKPTACIVLWDREWKDSPMQGG